VDRLIGSNPVDEELVTAAWQPVFEYRPDVNALAKLFAGAKRRKRRLEGRTLCFQLGSNGIRWTDTDEDVTARWDEVSEVWQRITRRSMNGVPTFTEYMIKLKLVDGRTKRLSGTLRPRPPGKARAHRSRQWEDRRGRLPLSSLAD
jgi:hypothetical protein